MRRWIATAVTGLAAVLVLSGCTSPTPPRRRPRRRLRRAGADAALTGPSTTVAVMGDSLSRGYNACDHFGDCTVRLLGRRHGPAGRQHRLPARRPDRRAGHREERREVGRDRVATSPRRCPRPPPRTRISSPC